MSSVLSDPVGRTEIWKRKSEQRLGVECRCFSLADALRELAKHGPLRPEETRGLSEDVGKMSHLDVNAYGDRLDY